MLCSLIDVKEVYRNVGLNTLNRIRPAEFDAFVNNVVQFLSSNKKRNRLDVKVDNLYLANQVIDVSALYLDNNFKFDPRASIQMTIVNEETKEQKIERYKPK